MAHYAALGLENTASRAEIKQAYTQLVLSHHPDKTESTNTTRFLQIQRAWEVLRDDELRREYDEEIKAQETLRSRVQLTVKESEMAVDEAEGFLWYECRCGGRYIIHPDELDQGFDHTQCEFCSFVICVSRESTTDTPQGRI
eukprot:c3251_g1_i1.p1 GENE.c3251_g1_i1~~c3251_g1_i1.p1  ORF type:complete len:142 (+),score=19.96 c3251_g1_i1:30-455(+)